MKQTTQTIDRPTRTVNFASFFIASDQRAGLITRRPPGTVRLKGRPASPQTHFELLPTRGTKPQLAPMSQTKLPVSKVKGRMSRAWGDSLKEMGSAELRIPDGLPRFVNAATLKRMLKASPSDTLLRRVGDAWEICENSTRIDLLDDTAEFRLGEIQIYS